MDENYGASYLYDRVDQADLRNEPSYARAYICLALILENLKFRVTSIDQIRALCTEEEEEHNVTHQNLRA